MACFDNIDHLKLLSALSQYIDDEPFLNWIETFLKTDIREKQGRNHRAIEKGIPQGSSNSPVLIHIFLHQFDLKMTTYEDEEHFQYVRYADDLLFAIKQSQKTKETVIGERQDSTTTETRNHNHSHQSRNK